MTANGLSFSRRLNTNAELLDDSDKIKLKIKEPLGELK